MSLEGAIADMIEDRMLDVHTALPARVTKYDPATQTADVLPLVRVNGEKLPVIPGVPVAWPRAGGAFVSLPMVAGDFVFLVFAEQALGVWRAVNGAETAPGDLRRHHLSGAVALPCLFPDSVQLADVHSDNVVVGFDGGNQVHIKPDGKVSLGSENPTDASAAASKVAIELNRLKADLTALKAAIAGGFTAVGVGSGANGPAGAASFNAAFTPSSPGDTASPTVLID